MEDKDIRAAWFNFLKAFTRCLTQLNLNKPDHPHIKQTIGEAHALLARIIESTPGNKFTLTLDDEKLLVNGFPLLTADKAPHSLVKFFSRIPARNISFLSGVSEDELRLLCQIQLFKGDSLEYLRHNHVGRIAFGPDTARNAPPSTSGGTAGEEAASSAGGNGPADKEKGPESRGAGTAEKLAETIAARNLESAVSALIAETGLNSSEQRGLFELVMKKFQAELESRLNDSLSALRLEKEKLAGDMARAEAVMSNIAEGVVVVDKDGAILMMNPQAEVISGKALSDVAGRKIFDIAQLEHQAMTLAWELGNDAPEKTPAAGSQKENAGFCEAVKKSTAIIQNEEGKIVGSLSIPTDQAKFREIEKLQQDFIATMTHELRSPLTSIKSALEILSRGRKPGAWETNMINTAIRNSERLNAIITDILDFSKLQSGTMVFHQECVRPEAIAREAADAMKAWANAKNIAIALRTPKNIPHIYADKRRTVQILINLISNAIKFTPKGGDITVGIERDRDAQSGFICFSVKDTGCGIKQEDQSRIFEKFIQVAMGEKIGGTGLGLPITKAMVLLQGGRITLESAPGCGSTFRVGMPVYKGQLDAPVFEQPPEMPATKPWWQKLIGL